VAEASEAAGRFVCRAVGCYPSRAAGTAYRAARNHGAARGLMGACAWVRVLKRFSASGATRYRLLFGWHAL